MEKKYISFNKEQKLLNHLVLHANDEPNALGLLNGQMGIIIVLVEFAKKRNLHQLERVADELMDNILKRVTKTTSIDFADGLCGIGWGIEYLIQNGYMQGYGADILSEIDQRIMEYDILRLQDMKLETGLEGILHYVLAHIQGANINGNKVFDKDYLKNLTTKVQQLCNCHQSHYKEIGKMYRMLVEGFNGSTNFYDFNTNHFVQKKYNNKLLSLKEGTAGRIKLILNGI